MMMMIIIIIFISSLLVLAAAWLCEKLWWAPVHIQKLMSSQGIKGPSYRFLHGNTKEISEARRGITSKPMEDDLSHDVFPRILPHIYSWKRLYGANFLYWLGPQPELVVTEAELVKEILSDRKGDYPKIELQGFSRRLLGDGIGSSKGEKWARMRKLANNVFHGESLRGMLPAMIESAETMVEAWREHEGKEIEAFEEFRLLTSEVISRTAFGSNYLEGKNIFEMLIKLKTLASKNFLNVRFPGMSRIMKNNDELESEKLEEGVRNGIIQIIKKREQTKTGEEQKSSRRSDFLEKLLEANHQENGDNQICIEAMVDECKTFYFAGHETTTSLLGWATLLLATHEDWQERARKEVMEVFGQENPTPYGIARLKIMNMILEETLRLYPPAPYIKRKVEKKNVVLGNITLPPNIHLHISPLTLQHDHEIWGKDVHKFKPERFAEGVVKATNNHPIAFLPFGYGPRTCLGLNFAMAEAKIVLSMILQRYSFVLSSSYVHSPVQLFTLRPKHGVQVILHRI
ncbi:PREDICTED: cytochrome P450 CYP749A22-like [Ipomoea nil]|uniref:cytochrome P450 CYP749A22-like n=1 Tax=Ipomoea nil TaxID=35883 RepID=UPI0009013A6B|nr:PREDICTED: cytochrome P450 CYP749A22-like [Ipomoea nil]